MDSENDNKKNIFNRDILIEISALYNFYATSEVDEASLHKA